MPEMEHLATILNHSRKRFGATWSFFSSIHLRLVNGLKVHPKIQPIIDKVLH